MRHRSVRRALFAAVVVLTAAAPSCRSGVRLPGLPRGTKGFPTVVSGAALKLRQPVAQAAGKVPRGSGPLAIGAALPAQPLGTLRRQLAAGAWADAALTARGLARGNPTALAEDLLALRVRCEALAELGQFRQAVAQPGATPDIDAWPGVVLALERENPAQAAVLRRYLACRAALEGNGPLARRLGGPTDARGLLRDLQRVASDAPPPAATTEQALGPPLPEGPPLGFLPPVREAPGADLPALRDLPAAEQKARAGVVRLIEQEAAHYAAQVRLLADRVSREDERPARRGPTDVAKGDPVVDDVERLLNRRSRPEERVLIRYLRTSHTAEATAAMLRQGGP